MTDHASEEPLEDRLEKHGKALSSVYWDISHHQPSARQAVRLAIDDLRAAAVELRTLRAQAALYENAQCVNCAKHLDAEDGSRREDVDA